MTYFNVTIESVSCTSVTVSGDRFTPSFNAMVLYTSGNNVQLVVYEAETVCFIEDVGKSISPTNGTQQITITMTTPLIGGRVYVLNVGQLADTPGIALSVQLLYAPVTNLYAWVDGQVLNVAWSPPFCGLNPTNYLVTICPDISGAGNPDGYVQTVTESNNGGLGFSINSEVPIAGNWSVTVVPQVVNSSGPAAIYNFDPTVNQAPSTITGPTQQGGGGGGGGGGGFDPTLPVVAKGPAVTALRVDSLIGNALSVFVTSPVVSGVHAPSDYVAVITWSGIQMAVSAPVPIAGAPSKDGQLELTFAFTDWAHPNDRRYSLLLMPATAAGVPTGPGGAGMPLMLETPKTFSAAADLQGDTLTVTARTAPLTGSWPATGLALCLCDDTGAVLARKQGDSLVQTLTYTHADPAVAYQMTAALCHGGGIGLAGDPLPLITATTTLQTVVIDGVFGAGVARLAATWTPVTNASVTGYRLSVDQGGRPLAEAVFAGDTGQLALPADRVWADPGALAVTLLPLAEKSTGPASPAITPLATVPEQLSAHWTSAGMHCTLVWQLPTALADAATMIEIRQGETLVKQDTTAAKAESYTVPTGVLNAGGGFSFRLRANLDGAASQTGPWTQSVAILSGAPGTPQVTYDGQTLTVRFAPVAGVTGYRLVLVQDGAEVGQPWYSAEPFAACAVTSDKALGAQVAVQAIGPNGLGPAASAPIFEPGWYPTRANSGGDTTLWLNPADNAAMAAHTITIGLPDLFPTTPQKLPIPVPPFTLAAVTGGQNQCYSYTLTLAGDAAALPWSFDGSAVRAPLFLAYQEFIKKLEGAGATPFGVQTVRSAIARAMPQTYAETLLYSYGFSADLACVDLTPGMILCAEHAAYQTLGRATPNQTYLNGFIPSASAEYTVAQTVLGSGDFTALDAFIGQLVGLGGTSVAAPPPDAGRQVGAAGLIDSATAAMCQPFLRLVYPRNFPANDADNAGDPRPGLNAVILAAPSYGLLEQATSALRIDGNALLDSVGALYFRGRSTLRPALRVWLGGAPLTVSLGTTVAGLLAACAMDPSKVPLPLTGLRLRRGVQSALVGLPATYDAGAPWPVRLDWAPHANGALTTLPLLGGDQLELGDGLRR